ncbi:N-acetylmuramoyl-L-alanine amidase family protein [[Eubacterium] hominis]|uniref:N-acetylmuramoyl-L-alanine amidase family protein n=1 Tax=[Eubacterium] hominis TaxID=2764325 RepID=UPI003A4DAFDA
MKKYKLMVLPCMILSLLAWYTFHHTSSNADLVYAKETQVTIVLDAGHGGYDSGGISAQGIYEKDITLSVTLQIGALLEDYGYEVIYTRDRDEVSSSEDNLEDLRERVNIATMAQADLFLSIHTNSSENYDDGAFGIEAYYNGTDETMKQLGTQVLNQLQALGYSDLRGLKSTADSSLYVIDQNNVSALLLELGFLSDSEDAAYLTSALGQQQMAQAIADAIHLQYGLSKSTS